MNAHWSLLFLLLLASSSSLSRASEKHEAASKLIETLHLPLKDGFTGQKLIFGLLQKLIDPFQPSESKTIKTFGPLATSFIASDALESLLSSLLVIPKQCFTPVRGYVHEELGDFTTTPDSPYCDSNCGRNLLCCGPSRPEEVGITYVYSNGVEPARFVYHGDKDFQEDVRRWKKPLLFYLNGSFENYTIQFWINQTRDGFLKQGYNVVLVDWSLNKFMPAQLAADSRIVGALIGNLIRWLDYVDQTTCLGMSLSSHTCGDVGRWLKQRGYLLPKCIALEPGAAFYDKCSDVVRIDRSDCGVVVGVHTSAYSSLPGLLLGKIGSRHKVGHCDFYVNTAVLQPNCFNVSAFNVINNLLFGRFGKIDYDLELMVFCSHARAELYLRSQVNELCRFTGWRVHNCDSASGCRPLDASMISPHDPAPGLMSFPPFDECTSEMRADYQISTTGTDPFC